MTNVALDGSVLPVGSDATKGMLLIVGLAVCDKFALCKNAVVRVDVFDISSVSRCKLLIFYFGLQCFFSSFRFLVVHPNVFGGLLDPDSGVGVALFRGFPVREGNQPWDSSFHCVDGNKIARSWVGGTHRMGWSIVGILLCIPKFACQANGDGTGGDFDQDVKASFASPGLYILEAPVTKLMVKMQHGPLVDC